MKDKRATLRHAEWVSHNREHVKRYKSEYMRRWREQRKLLIEGKISGKKMISIDMTKLETKVEESGAKFIYEFVSIYGVKPNKHMLAQYIKNKQRTWLEKQETKNDELREESV